MGKTIKPSDYGTPEISRRYKVKIERAGKFKRRIRVVNETEIDKLLLDGRITEEEYDTAARLAKDCYRAGLAAMPLSNMERSGKSDPWAMSDKRSEIIGYVSQAFAAIEKVSYDAARAVFLIVVESRPGDLPAFRIGIKAAAEFYDS